MKLRLYLAVLATAMIALPLGLTADPVSDDVSFEIKLASLSAHVTDSKRPPMTIIPKGVLDKMLGIPAGNGIQYAGRCGSSNYYCDSPGFTYCCGNSTDGFYCAADVNGC